MDVVLQSRPPEYGPGWIHPKAASGQGCITVLLLGPVEIGGITLHPPITQDEAEAYLAQDLVKALSATLRYCPVLATESEGRLAAIVDFTFNLGAGRLQTSTLRRRINQSDWASAARELRRWVYGGGKVLPGLVARRQAEISCLCP